MDQLFKQLSETVYSKYLIVKGGFQLTTSHGLESRATGELDFTVKGIELNKENILSMFQALSTLNGKKLLISKVSKKQEENLIIQDTS